MEQYAGWGNWGKRFKIIVKNFNEQVKHSKDKISNLVVRNLQISDWAKQKLLFGLGFEIELEINLVL